MLAFENVTEKYNFFELFDGGVASYEANQVKPEEGIYKKLIDRYKINPEESIFIDDLQHNIEAANKLGFNTIHLTNPKDLREKLRRYDLNI
ncbi:HAD-IA family hydrolase [Paenibacillus sp. BJ-4]|uniref:HAD-IA family hydrolase n=1 Tax=Paenibacillus sp. BJ-4 TaxID=2878097 RepID=UPI001CF0A13E|nr:HAD-IA family hydrolase [Paenibacillus sp. BJ-4]